MGTIVERTTGYLTLLHLPQGHKADQVAAAVVTQMTALPNWFTKTLTWDRGRRPMTGSSPSTSSTRSLAS